MNVSCFPVSVQAGSYSDQTDRRFEVDLIGELAGTIIEFASRLASTQKSHAVPSQTDKLNAARTSRDQGRLAILAADADAAVRSEVIFNPATPMWLLKQLAHDQNKFVAAQARAELDLHSNAA